MPLLSAEGLVKVYGRRRVVDGGEFHVDQGEIVGLLGPSGAGKTTSFRMTCGMVSPDSGRVLLDDEEITHWPMFKRAGDGGRSSSRVLPRTEAASVLLSRTKPILAKFGHEGNRTSAPPIFTGIAQLAGTAWGQKMARALPTRSPRST